MGVHELDRYDRGAYCNNLEWFVMIHYYWQLVKNLMYDLSQEPWVWAVGIVFLSLLIFEVGIG